MHLPNQICGTEETYQKIVDGHYRGAYRSRHFIKYD